MSEKTEDLAAVATTCVNIAVSLGLPVIGPVVSIASPVLQRFFGRIFIMIENRNLSNVGRARLGVVYVSAAKKMNSIFNRNEPINSFIISSSNSTTYTKADEIIESILWSAVNDPESEKSLCYGLFIGGIPFIKEINHSRLTELLVILRQLTYDEIKELRLLSDNNVYDFSSLEINVLAGASVDDSFRFARLIHLKNLGLIIQNPPYSVGSVLGREKITSLGIDLINYLDMICH